MTNTYSSGWHDANQAGEKKGIPRVLSWLFLFVFVLAFAPVQAQYDLDKLPGTDALYGAKFVAIHKTIHPATNQSHPSFQNVPKENRLYWIRRNSALKRRGKYLKQLGEDERDALRTATIVVDFGPGWAQLGENEQAARDAFLFATGIWETEVVSPVPILIAADFAELGGGVIASNGSPFVTDVPNAPDPSIVYTLSLANAIAGVDLAPGTPNGNQTYNLNFDFYFGTDGNTPANLTDFVTVVLHEIGHSMGMSGLSNGGNGVGANGGANPAIFDTFVELGDGTPILDLEFGSPAQVDALVSGDLFMNAPTAVEALAGQRPPIYAPSQYQGGSSYSHWDETSFPAGDPNSLMTPFIGRGEANFNIGNIFRGLLADEGWQLSSEIPQLDVGVTQIVSPVDDSDLGEEELITVLIRNDGLDTVSNFEVAYQLDGGEIITEIFEDTIVPVSTAEFTFSTSVDLSADASTFNITAFTLLTDDANPSNDSASVEVRNLVPDFSLVPNGLIDFGLTGIGVKTSRVITFNNTATGEFAGELDINALDFSAANVDFSVDVESFPITVLPGESVEVVVNFMPSSQGPITDTLDIFTNAGSTRLFLNGEGADPAVIGVNPESISATLNVGESTTEALEISNSGVANLEFSISLRRTTSTTDGDANQVAASPIGREVVDVKNNLLSAQAFKNISKLRTVEENNNTIAENSIYTIDDGSEETNLGFNADFELMWMNAFQTVGGAEVITSISSAVANAPASGLPARYLLYEDPNDDGDPSDAVLLAETSAVLVNPGTNEFTTASISPTRVSGVFFIAVLVQEDDGASAFPGPLDDSSPSQQASWVIGNSGIGGFNADTLTSNSFGPFVLDDIGFPGNWLLRADGLFFGVTPASGSVVANESLTLDVEIIGSIAGSFEGEIVIENNDPQSLEVVVPVSLIVGGGPVIEVNPSEINALVGLGASTVETVTVANTGGANLEFEVSALRRTDTTNTLRGLAATSRATQSPVSSTNALQSQNLVKVGTGEVNKNTIAENAVYQLDDGSVETSLGFNDEFELMWMNAFQTVGGAEVITSISSAVANAPTGGLNARFILYDDPNNDGDPSDAIILTETSGVLVNPGTDEFTTVSIDPTAVNGVFFIAVLVQEDGVDVVFPGPLDSDSPSQGASWVIGNAGIGGFNADTLTSNSFGPFQVDAIGFAGDWLLRADGLFFNITPGSGTVAAGDVQELQVELFGSSLGVFEGDILINSNDAENPTVTVPVTLTVGDGALNVRVEPDSLGASLPQGQTSEQSFTIFNDGNNPISYNITVAEQEGSNITLEPTLVRNRDLSGLVAPIAESFSRPGSFPRYKWQVPIIIGEEKTNVSTIVFETGFEAPDYNLGDINDQQGWFAQRGNWNVSDASPATDTQHLQGIGDAQDTTSFSVSPNGGIGTEPFSTVSMDISINGTGHTWEVIPQSPTAGFVNTRLRFNPDGSITVLEGNSGTFVPVNATIPNGYFNLVIEMTRATAEFKVYFDGVEVFSGLGFAGDLEEVVFLNGNETTNTMDIDNLEIIDGQASGIAPIVSTDPTSGQIAPGDSAIVNVTFDANRPLGFYEADILVGVTDGNDSTTLVVNTTLEVTGDTGFDVAVNPSALSDSLLQGTTSQQSFDIINNGSSEVTFDINIENTTTVQVRTTSINTQALNDPKAQAILRPNGGTSLYSPGNLASTIAFETGFEAPDYTIGNLNGQQGWFSQFSDWEVLDVNPALGTQHVQSSADSSGVTSFAISPNGGVGTEAISTLSLDVQLTGSGTTWDIIPQSPSVGLVNTRLRFNPDGSIQALVADSAQGSVFVPVNATIPNGYFNVRIEVERSTSAMRIFLDDVEVLNDQAVAGNIEELVLLTFNELGSALDLDNVQIIDGQIDGETETPFVSAAPTSGTVPASSITTITVTFDANRPVGLYEGDIVVNVSDVNNNATLNVDATLAVLDDIIPPTGPRIRVTPQLVEETLEQGQLSERTLIVENIGGGELKYEIDLTGVEVDSRTNTERVRTELALGTPNSSTQYQNNDPEFLAKMAEDKASSINFVSEPTTKIIVVGDVLLEENFDGNAFPPNGWNVVDNAGTGVAWSFAAQAGEANYSGSNEAATTSSDSNRETEFDTELRTPAINVQGKQNVVLEFTANYQNFANRDFLDTDISLDGGNTWRTLLNWNEDHGAFRSLPGEKVVVQLDEFIEGASDVIIRWRYYDPQSNDWDWYAQIDDVRVSESAVVWLSANPITGVLAAGEQDSVTLSFDASVLDPDFYVAGILVSSNDPTNPLEAAVATLMVIPAQAQATQTGQGGLLLYPNPSEGAVSIQLSDEVISGKIEIYGAQGLILSKPLNNTQGVSMDISSLRNGVYIVRIVDGEKVITKQFIKR